jgi:hypothetical protein
MLSIALALVVIVALSAMSLISLGIELACDEE